MGIEHLLPELVGETAHLVTIFCEIGRRYGRDDEAAVSLFRMLPQQLKSAQAFYDRFGSRWRYVYGEPFDFPGSSQVVVGVAQFPEVEHLYLAMTLMESHLSSTELLEYIGRLGVRSKHHEVLFEARPLLFLDPRVTASFEVVGFGKGNKTIDWLFGRAGSTNVLVEVKYRVVDVVQHFEPMMSSLDSGRPVIASGPALSAPLFPSTYDKFLPNAPSVQLQGAWISSNIKVKPAELQYTFQSLPEDHLHFAVLSGWSRDGLLLTRSGIDRGYIKETLGLVEGFDAVVIEDNG
jgi:hypothetical protein